MFKKSGVFQSPESAENSINTDFFEVHHGMQIP